jgi:radical SAM superfamily enzyme YgiQ (UPF0313 family)
MNRTLILKADSLLSKEKGTIYKEHGGRITVCLVYPDTYRVGMSNLGFQGIYGLLNKRDDVVCERAFLPDEDDRDEYRRTATPVFSLESKTPLHRFDIVAFSVSFENDYPNIARILDMAKIPFLCTDRNSYHPLIIGGGVFAFFNPEPLAPALDIIFIGEAEESLNEFIDTYRDGSDREDVKRKALCIEGVYVPGFYCVEYNEDGTPARRTALYGAPEKITRRYLKDLSRSPITTAIVTPEAEFSDMYLVEAMRGCPWACRFCLVGHIYNPVRKKGRVQIMAEIRTAQQHARKVGVIGPSLTDYPYIEDVLCMEGVSFSITSLRASERSAGLMQLLKGNRSISIAPEAGTERMRRVINKKITEKDIMDTAGLIFASGIENLRLYFMIGLPAETHEDIAGIVELVEKVRAISPRGNIVLSVSTFIPKPFTPFQWHPMEPLASVKGKLKFIKKSLKGMKGIRVLHDLPKSAPMQGFFSNGDRRAAKVVQAMAKGNDWLSACAAAEVDSNFYVYRKKDLHEIMPWDFIETGVTKEALRKEYRKALSLSGDLL